MATGIEPIAYEITKAAVGGLVKPALSAAYGGLRSLTQTVISGFGDRFSEYVAQQAARHSKLSTIVFGHQKSLDELYIPLTIIPSRSAEQPVTGRSTEILIDRFHTKLLPNETRVLITDTAGMGKSTLSKFLFLQCLKSLYAIPIFIELRHLSEKNTVSSVIQKQLNSLPVCEDEPRFNKRQVERLFSKGGMVFFFDGFDEIPFKERESVTRDVKDFIDKYPNNIFIITSRPETGLLAFPSFRQFNIRPLAQDESFALIRKYDQEGGRSEQLIQKLGGRDFQAVQEFLKNPLLTSLLYRSFEYKQNVPLKKHIFYRQVYDALFDWHDATKDGYNTREKKSGLDIDTFHRVLRVVGFVSVMKGEVEGDTDSVLTWIRKARSICTTAHFSESSFLDDLVRAVPLFVKEGDTYRWSHKSLAEYFAAQYICTEGKSQQGQVLGALLSTGRTSRFSNVLDQIYDIDATAFRTHLILPMAQAFAAFWRSAYRNLDPAIDVGAIRTRKELLFDRRVVLLPLALLREGKLHAEISPILGFAGDRLDIFEQANFEMYLYDRDEDQVIGLAAGSFAAIADILASKRDPLVRRFNPEESYKAKGRLRVPLDGKPHLISDDPGQAYNQPQGFVNFSASLLRHMRTPLVDSDRLLQFEAAFQDSDRLSELAEELIRPLVELSRESSKS